MKKTSPILMALGAILIFCSWISQNYFEKKWQSEFEQQRYIRDKIMRETQQYEVWFIEFHRQLESKKDLDLLANAAICLSSEALTIMSWSEALAHKQWNINYSPKATDGHIEKMQTFVDTKQYVEIIKETMAIIKKYNEWKRPQDIDARFKIAYDNQDEWNFKFLLLYIVGSIFVSIGWVIDKFQPIIKKTDTNEALIVAQANRKNKSRKMR